MSLQFDYGDYIFREGEIGEAFYILRSGRLRIIQQNSDGIPQTVGHLYSGDHFGEGSLVLGQGHRATIRATEPSEVLIITKSVFLRALSSSPALKEYIDDQITYIAYRDFTRLIKGGSQEVSGEAIQHLFQSLQKKIFPPGTSIINIGEAGDEFYLIAQGNLKAVSSEGVIYELSQGEFFGEQALIENAPHSVSITAETSVVLYTLAKEIFESIIDRIPLLRQAFEQVVISRDQHSISQEAGLLEKSVEQQSNHSHNDVAEKSSTPNGLPRGMRRFPFLKQRDETDCGAACLAMICKYYRMPVGLSRLRDLANVSRYGATMAGLAEAAETLGFVSRGVRAGYEELMRTKMPIIVHWQGIHFVVLFRITDHQAFIADPAVGIRKISRTEFETEWTNFALLLEYSDQVAKNEAQKSSFRRFLPLVRPYTGILSEILLASILISLFGLASPIFTQTIVDQVLVHQDRDLLNILLVGMIIIMAFQIGTSALRMYLIASVSARLSITMLSQFYRHLLNLSMRFFALRRIGDITTRFQENTKIQNLLTVTTISALLDVIMLVVYLGLMFYYHFNLALIVLAFIPLSVGLTLIYTPILKSISQRIFLARSEQSSTLIGSLHGIEVVKAQAVERDMRWQWEKRYTKEIQIGFQGIKVEMLFGSLSSVVNLFSGMFILWHGATLVMDGELSIGQLMAFNALIGNVMGPITGLIKLWPQIQEARIALDRLNDIYDAPIEKARQEDYAVTPQRIEGHIVFDKVFFRYGIGTEVPYVLNGINLTIEPGEKVAIVGRSGAGKTTLVKLVPRLFDPTEGVVTLDRIDLRDVNPGWLRRQVGMVLQDPFLFSGTIAENIALGIEEIDMNRVIEVARLAYAHDFIASLTMGYETKIGEQGMGLSGGQRQRIAIARALFMDPQILIFDEATNSLDTESEQALRDNLEEILQNRTSFIIAHRLSTVRSVDRIIVLDQGHIVESGEHDSLMAQEGLYYHLIGQQLPIA